uniref:Uncharacterized protein n=1 Tax=Angiostrongylus cantonensis TaxID=6313 RepID=A0A0K0CXB1_ANGCA
MALRILSQTSMETRPDRDNGSSSEGLKTISVLSPSVLPLDNVGLANISACGERTVLAERLVAASIAGLGGA